MNKILIISRAVSDLSDLILKNCQGSALVSPDMGAEISAEEFDAVCVGGK